MSDEQFSEGDLVNNYARLTKDHDYPAVFLELRWEAEFPDAVELIRAERDLADKCPQEVVDGERRIFCELLKGHYGQKHFTGEAIGIEPGTDGMGLTL